MIQKSILLMSIFVLAACGTSSKEDSEQAIPTIDSIQSTPSSNSSRTEPKESKKASNSGQTSEARPTPPANDLQVLSEAVRANDYDGIYKAATSVLSKNPNEVKALNALGLYHAHKGHYAAATMMYDRALKANPNSSEAHNNLALTLLAQKENREAVEEFRKSLALNNEEGAAAANLGSIYVEHKSYTKALVANEIAYKKNSKDPKVLNNYAVSLAAVGKYKEAQDIYKKGLSLNGDGKELIVNYAILLIDHLNQNEEGLDLINKARFLGISPEARNRINVLENKAKSGVK